MSVVLVSGGGSEDTMMSVVLDLLDLLRLQGPSVNSSPPQASVVHNPNDFIYTVKLGVFPECVYIG